MAGNVGAGNAGEIEIRPLGADDAAQVAVLHAAIFGPGRFARTAYRVREGALKRSRHCRVALRRSQSDNPGQDFEMVACVTMTPVTVGDSGGHWLLGPLGVRSGETNRGLGGLMVEAALASVAADDAPGATVILVGDLAYYERFGFAAVPPGRIVMPGPVDAARLLIWLGADGHHEMPSGLVHASES